jgi:hypothetical protein
MLGFGVFFSLRSAIIQKNIAETVSEFLSKELKTKVHVKALYPHSLNSVELKELYIEDLEKDTLFYIGNLRASIRYFNTAARQILFRRVSINNALVNFKEKQDSSGLNLDFFVDYFSGQDTTLNQKNLPWTIVFEELNLNKSAFSFKLLSEVSGRKFKESDFRFDDIYASFDDFTVVDDSLAFVVKNLALKEKNSFSIKHFSAKANIHPNGMAFANLLLRTNHSLLKDSLSFSYQGWKDLANFTDKVILKSRLKNSIVSFKDLAYFSDYLAGWEYEVDVNGLVSGPVVNLKGYDVEINAFEKSFFNGKFDITGLPDIDNTLMNFKVSNAQSTSEELAKIIMSPLPDVLMKLGLISFEGEYNGFINDFVAFGKISSGLGNLDCDVQLTLDKNYALDEYSGKVDFKDFYLGALLGSTAYVNKTSFSGNINGKGTEIETMKLAFDGSASSIEINHHIYKDLFINGMLKDKVFSGLASMNDKNLKFDFNGKIFFDSEEPVFNFISKVEKANLALLGIDTLNPTDFSAEIISDFEGASLDALVGSIQLNDLSILRNDALFTMEKALLVSKVTSGTRSLKLQSDFINGSINGQFQLSEMPLAFHNFLALLLPNTLKLKSLEQERQRFNFDLKLNSLENLCKMYLPETSFESLFLQGDYDTKQAILNMSLKVKALQYQDYKTTSLFFKTNSDANQQQGALFDLHVGRLGNTSQLITDTITVHAQVNDNVAAYHIVTNNKQHDVQVNLQGDIGFLTDSITASFKDAFIQMDTLRWRISDSTDLVLKQYKQLYINAFALDHLGSFAKADGALGSLEKNLISLKFNNFELKKMQKLLASFGFEKNIGGAVNGTFDLFDFNEGIPLVKAKLLINTLTLDNDTLGDLNLLSFFNQKHELINVNGTLDNGLFKNLSINGFIKTREKENPLNLLLSMSPTQAKVFEPLFGNYIKDLSGSLQAKIRIAGNLNNPDINGFIGFDDFWFTVDYLNTRYGFTQNINLSKNKIEPGGLLLKDNFGGVATASGFIKHRNFTDFQIAIRLDNIQKLQCLNTTAKTTEMYYGKAYLSGNASFFGTPDNIVIKANAKTEKGTYLNIPLENYSESKDYSFIHFVNPKETSVRQAYKDFTGIELDFDLEVTPQAEVQLIFDSKLGDIMKGRGTSPSLKLRINRNGDFSMFGQYNINQGDYLFTAVSLINKKFLIQKGSTIDWNGDPLNARIDVSATYSAKASPENLVIGLVSADELPAFRQRIDVLTLMNLKGDLMTPEISFGLEFPDLSMLASGTNITTLTNVARRISNDQEELTRQVFSLLVANVFMRPAINQQLTDVGGADVQSGLLSSSVGDLLTNQFSNWLGQINSKWNLGVNYIFGDNKVNQSEILFSASRRFFDDRLEIQGTVGSSGNVGNFTATYSLSDNGNSRIKAFNRTGLVQNLDRNINTQGIGYFYRREFDLMSEDRKKARILINQLKNR